MNDQPLGLPVQGFLNLDKPASITSHDCVKQVRRLLGLKRVGHAGTLDPLATGVLPIALGSATRLLQFLEPSKVYQATIRFGLRTTTDDLAGEPLASHPVPELSLNSVKTALEQFQGKIQQLPPHYSAVQVQGQRLYQLARAGKMIEVAARPVEIFKLEVLDWRAGDFPELDLAISCGPGTYIRAIARDLGAVLETGGTLAALARTQSSGFKLADSLTLPELDAQVQRGSFCPISCSVALNHLSVVTLAAETAQRWCWGQRISLDAAEQFEALRVYHEDGRFLGVGQQVVLPDSCLLVPQVVLPVLP